ncbi:hypothetical protein FRC11_002215, partial [Ceratobasidium sp. 423]
MAGGGTKVGGRKKDQGKRRRGQEEKWLNELHGIADELDAKAKGEGGPAVEEDDPLLRIDNDEGSGHTLRLRKFRWTRAFQDGCFSPHSARRIDLHRARRTIIYQTKPKHTTSTVHLGPYNPHPLAPLYPYQGPVIQVFP